MNKNELLEIKYTLKIYIRIVLYIANLFLIKNRTLTISEEENNNDALIQHSIFRRGYDEINSYSFTQFMLQTMFAKICSQSHPSNCDKYDEISKLFKNIGFNNIDIKNFKIRLFNILDAINSKITQTDKVVKMKVIIRNLIMDLNTLKEDKDILEIISKIKDLLKEGREEGKSLMNDNELQVLINDILNNIEQQDQDNLPIRVAGRIRERPRIPRLPPNTEIIPPRPNVPQPGSDLPQPPGTVVPQPGSDLPEPGSDLPQPGSDLPQPGSDLPQPGSDLPQPGPDLPQPGSDLPEPPRPEELELETADANTIIAAILANMDDTTEEIKPPTPPGENPEISNANIITGAILANMDDTPSILTLTQEALEQQRLAAERVAAEAAAKKAEEERLAAERVAALAAAAAKKAADDKAAEAAARTKAEAAKKAEDERLAALAAAQEAERVAAANKAEAERVAAELAANKAEEDRLEALAAAKAEEERLAALAAAKAEEERLAALAAAKAEEERLEALAAAKAEEERLAALAAAKKAAAEKAEALKKAADEKTATLAAAAKKATLAAAKETERLAAAKKVADDKKKLTEGDNDLLTKLDEKLKEKEKMQNEAKMNYNSFKTYITTQATSTIDITKRIDYHKTIHNQFKKVPLNVLLEVFDNFDKFILPKVKSNNTEIWLKNKLKDAIFYDIILKILVNYFEDNADDTSIEKSYNTFLTTPTLTKKDIEIIKKLNIIAKIKEILTNNEKITDDKKIEEFLKAIETIENANSKIATQNLKGGVNILKNTKKLRKSKTSSNKTRKK
jgi:hypothetical protein